MANRRRNRMPVADRAKQFMPFSALKGLEEALEAVETEMMMGEKATSHLPSSCTSPVLSPDTHKSAHAARLTY